MRYFLIFLIITFTSCANYSDTEKQIIKIASEKYKTLAALKSNNINKAAAEKALLEYNNKLEAQYNKLSLAQKDEVIKEIIKIRNAYEKKTGYERKDINKFDLLLEKAKKGQIVIERDIEDLSKKELWLLRNTYFARHGMVFTSPELDDYFSKMSWYEKNENYSEKLLSSSDKKSILLIMEKEKSFNN